MARGRRGGRDGYLMTSIRLLGGGRNILHVHRPALSQGCCFGFPLSLIVYIVTPWALFLLPPLSANHGFVCMDASWIGFLGVDFDTSTHGFLALGIYLCQRGILFLRCCIC